MIYFIRDGHDAIKIGVCDQADVSERIAQMQTGNSRSLVLLGVQDGSFPKEAELHREFKHLAIRGEWFEGAPELWDYIRKNTRMAKPRDSDRRDRFTHTKLIPPKSERQLYLESLGNPSRDEWDECWALQTERVRVAANARKTLREKVAAERRQQLRDRE